MKIRRAEPSDIGDILALLKVMHAESRFAGIPIEDGRFCANCATWIDSPHCLVAVADAEAELVGVVIAQLAALDWCDELFAQERYFYVRPGRRGSWAALKLVDEYVSWAAGHKVFETRIGISAGVNDEGARDFFVRLGFKVNEPMLRLSRGPQKGN